MRYILSVMILNLVALMQLRGQTRTTIKIYADTNKISRPNIYYLYEDKLISLQNHQSLYLGFYNLEKNIGDTFYYQSNAIKNNTVLEGKKDNIIVFKNKDTFQFGFSIECYLKNDSIKHFHYNLKDSIIFYFPNNTRGINTMIDGMSIGIGYSDSLENIKNFTIDKLNYCDYVFIYNYNKTLKILKKNGSLNINGFNEVEVSDKNLIEFYKNELLDAFYLCELKALYYLLSNN